MSRRSYLAEEFGIKNAALNLSCFLNVALQALWVFPTVRTNIVAFCDQRDGGPPELKPLINAIQDFFRYAMDTSLQDSRQRHVHVFESA